MSFSVENSALMLYLKRRDLAYYAKAGELRAEVTKWLSYVPQTFPHYTSHTVAHSDQIVLQVSKLLFDDHASKPTVELSGVEAYALIAAAYLHDAGMVASDREKAEILKSEAWQRWTTGGEGGAQRWADIQSLRSGDYPADKSTRDFLADVQTRFLIAEFIRRTHHLRAAVVIAQHQDRLGRFAFDDPQLQNTIADICVAHGLKQFELEDSRRYPDRRQIRGEDVNVRFLAILLRLGDLLDMSTDRACPLLLNAACPLPPDSLAHWTQYQRIQHFMVAPKRIEVRAECHTQEEHRFLQDWCQWLEQEVRNAAVVIPKTSRHQHWRAPAVQIGGENATISIEPAKGAKYIPGKWTFELDRDLVLERFTRDVLEKPEDFIRELIQNSLDAMRCKMYADLAAEGRPLPEFPTQAPEEFRNRFRLEIALRNDEVENPLSGQKEQRQVLIVDDPGLGMDRDIIERYFLQVGRSFYVTDEFRGRYAFTPTSRFGVGFLSVFAVSDDVRVETYKPASPRPDGPLRLRLRGVKGYLLTEKGERQKSGTRIEVVLRTNMEPGSLTELVQGWCRRVEFPILVNDLGRETLVTAENPEQFAYEHPDLINPGARFVGRIFAIDRPGFEGEIYILAYVDDRGESWATQEWGQSPFDPLAVIPNIVPSVLCSNGIARESDFIRRPSWSVRVDRRGPETVNLSRQGSIEGVQALFLSVPELRSRLQQVLDGHLDSTARNRGEHAWLYRQKLATEFRMLEYWSKILHMIPLLVNGDQSLRSMREIADMQSIRMEVPFQIIPLFWNELLETRSFTAVEFVNGRHIATLTETCGPPRPYRQVYFSDFAAENPIGVSLDHRYTLLNIRNPLVAWYQHVRAWIHDTGERSISLDVLTEYFRWAGGGTPKPLSDYLDKLRKLPGLPPELMPPKYRFRRPSASAR